MSSENMVGAGSSRDSVCSVYQPKHCFTQAVLQSTSRRDSGCCGRYKSVGRCQRPGQGGVNSDQGKDRGVDLALLQIVPFIAGLSTPSTGMKPGICGILKVTVGLDR